MNLRETREFGLPIVELVLILNATKFVLSHLVQNIIAGPIETRDKKQIVNILLTFQKSSHLPDSFMNKMVTICQHNTEHHNTLRPQATSDCLPIIWHRHRHGCAWICGGKSGQSNAGSFQDLCMAIGEMICYNNDKI